MGAKTLVILGYSPATGDSMAKRFGKEGFRIALCARNSERLTKAVERLAKAGITAKGYACDVFNQEALLKTIADVQNEMGQIGVLVWNTWGKFADDPSPDDAKNLLTIKGEDIDKDNRILKCFLASLQAVLDDLKATKGSLICNSCALGTTDPARAPGQLFLRIGPLTTALAARRHAVCVLNTQLKDEGVFVGEVIINTYVKNSALDSPGQPDQMKIHPDNVADFVWTQHTQRSEWSSSIGILPPCI